MNIIFNFNNKSKQLLLEWIVDDFEGLVQEEDLGLVQQF